MAFVVAVFFFFLFFFRLFSQRLASCALSKIDAEGPRCRCGRSSVGMVVKRPACASDASVSASQRARRAAARAFLLTLSS